MVVLAVSILNTSGKVLLSRQFVDMTRIRIEGLLAAFPKLLGSNVEHTFVETENVRYVYHPLESMYLICITNKGSNIIEDLATLQMLSKVVPEICSGLTEEAVLENSFDLIFAFDEVLTGGGYKVGLSMSDLQANLLMDSHEEKLQQMIRESKEQEAHDTMMLQADIIKQQKREGATLGGKYAGMGSNSSTSDPTSSGIGSGSMSRAYLSAGANIGTTSDSSHMALADQSAVSSFSSTSTPVVTEPVRSAPTKSLSLNVANKNSNFLQAMAAEDNLQQNFYQKTASADKGPTAPVAAAPRGPVGDLELSCVETIRVLATRDSDLDKMEVKGAMTLTAHSERAGLATIKFAKRELDGLTLQPNPLLDRKALQQHVIRPRAPTRPFPVGVPSGIIKWRFSTDDKSYMPLSINVWPETSAKSTTVSIEYTLENLDMELHDVSIIIPLGSSATPEVLFCDGVHRHVAKSESIEWRHELIDENSASGQLEFVVSGTDEDAFFPCTVQFSSKYNYADIKFEAAVDAEKSPLKISAENVLSISEYTVS